MRCKLCSQKAIYTPLRFCKEHFLAYYEKRVRKYFESTHTRNVKVLIAVSGGKDSSALAAVLSSLGEEFGLELALFIIDLKIPNYSEKGVKIVKELSKEYDIPLIVEDLAEHPKIIPDFAGLGKKPCSQCGVVKRFLLNKMAVEHGYDFIATGHNLDDEFYFCMHNLLHRNVDQLRRQQKILPPKPKNKLAGRLKPLYYLTEKENRLYCLLKSIPHDADECPFSKGNPQVRFKEEFAAILRDQKKNVLKSVLKLQEAHEAVEGDEKDQLHDCPSCGYPTTSKNQCVFCTIMAQ